MTNTARNTLNNARAEQPRFAVAAKATLADLVGQSGSVSQHGAGSLLFTEGEVVRGVHLVCSGRVRLSMDSADGKRLVLKIAKAGDFLDLGSCVAGRPHEVTAEIIEECALRFVPQQEFLRLIQQDGRTCLLVAEALGRDFHDACRSITLIGLSRTAESRIAELLLRDAEENSATDRSVVKLNSTHEQIAQMIGTSRETVTRVLARLRHARIIDINGKTVTLRNPEMLQRIGELNESIAQIATHPMGASRMARAAV